MIRMEHMTKIYHVGDEEVRALDDLSLHVRAGEFIAICGPSGSGKTTLMNMMGCLDVPDFGSYLLDGVEAGTILGEDELNLEAQTKVYVETGMSDGSYLIVTGEGLKAGDRVWLTNLRTTAVYSASSSSSSSASGFSFGGMPSGTGSQMPGGFGGSGFSGQMPGGFGRQMPDSGSGSGNSGNRGSGSGSGSGSGGGSSRPRGSRSGNSGGGQP